MDITYKRRSRVRVTIPAEFVRKFVLESFEDIPEDADFWLDKRDGNSVNLAKFDRIRVDWTEEKINAK